MYFNRKNSQQKNWRMIKKGKHFLFGCALVFAIGATANVASAETVVSDATADQTQQLTENSESASSETATSTTAVSEEATSTTATSEVASETVASSETASTTSEVATSETSTAASSEVASSETSTSATEVAASETSSTAAATSVANRTAYIGYEVQYTTSSGDVVGKTANIVAADTTEAVATATLTVSATDVPAGYELAAEQAYSLTQQISENQINILSFAIVKKSEEEEIAASQLENKTPLLQAIAEAEALTSEATRLLATSQKENSSLAVAADATKAVTAEARTVLKDATASEEQVQATTATVQASSVSLGEELAKLSADGIVTAQLNSVTGLANVVDQYNITWDNQSVTGRNDAGFQLVTDANGKRILVYKYNLADGTAFSMNDVLAQLNAIPKDANAGLRTLDGTEKSKLEAGTDGYSFSADTAKLNGQTIDFLDVVNLNPLWGGRPVVGATEGTNPNYSTFYVPGSTNIGTKSQEITVGGTNGTGTVTLSGTNELNFYSNQIDRQKLYIRSVAASYEGGTNSAVATDTDTDTIPVYMVGYKDLITVNSTATNVQINDGLVPNAIFIFGTNQGTTEDRDGVTGTAPVADPTKATRKVAEFANIDADGSNATNATVATVAYNDLKNTMPDLASNNKTELTVTTDGYLTGKLNYGPGAKSSRRLDVTDSLGGTRDSDPFLVLGYTDKVADTTAVAKEFGVRPTTAEIYSKLAIDVNSSYPNAVPSTLVIPEDQYTREIVGYRTVSTSGTTETKGATTAATASTLPTSGTYEVRVKTTNIYGQEIYNWVRVQHEENEAPTVTVNSTATNVQIDDGSVPNAIFIFGTSQGTTEDVNGATGTSPVASKDRATRKVAEISDPDGTISTIVYNDLVNNKPDLASSEPNQPELTVSKDGYLEGKLIYGPGAKSTRRLDVTDNKGTTTNSTAFKVLGYTDKVADTTAIAKEEGVNVTADEIYSKLAIDVNSSYPNAVPSTLVIPEDQYTREIVGYRTVSTSGTTVTKGATTAATASTLPTSGTYEVRVKTTNIYGQEIYNWVTVEYTDTTAPEAPTVKANDDGSVTVTPSQTAGDDTKTVALNYTDENGAT
ncbi:TPA: hypothetical protein ACGO2G_002088, partial [Streptococcus suis]